MEAENPLLGPVINALGDADSLMDEESTDLIRRYVQTVISTTKEEPSTSHTGINTGNDRSSIPESTTEMTAKWKDGCPNTPPPLRKGNDLPRLELKALNIAFNAYEGYAGMCERLTSWIAKIDSAASKADGATVGDGMRVMRNDNTTSSGRITSASGTTAGLGNCASTGGGLSLP
eukprot:Lankesteria_metandrocarpae@DN7251_c0_g1_i1.p1